MPNVYRFPDGPEGVDCFSPGGSNFDSSLGIDLSKSAQSSLPSESGRHSIILDILWGQQDGPDNGKRLLDLDYSTSVVKVYKPNSGLTHASIRSVVAKADEVLGNESVGEKLFWSIAPGEGEEVDAFREFLSWITAEARNAEGEDTIKFATGLLRMLTLWRTGVPKAKDSGPSARVKGLWGELHIMQELTETFSARKLDASLLWRRADSKWDIQDSTGLLYPGEVKTTAANEHRHILRHSQISEGRRCGLRLLSVRCAVTESPDSPDLRQLLLHRLALAEQAGPVGKDCLRRCRFELKRLTPVELSTRLRQEGHTVLVPINSLPEFPSIPAEYTKITYEVLLNGEDGVSGLLI